MLKISYIADIRTSDNITSDTTFKHFQEYVPWILCFNDNPSCYYLLHVWPFMS